MARRRRSKSDDDDGQRQRQRQLHHRRRRDKGRRRRRLHVLADDCERGFSMYRLNLDHLDSGSEDDSDLDSSSRRLGCSRLVVRMGLGCGGGQTFVGVGTRIFNLHGCSARRPGAAFDTRTRLVTTPPPLQARKECAAFWAAGRAVYALDCRPTGRWLRDGPRPQPGCFERLGREPKPGYGHWRWEALPPPPFRPGTVLSHAVHPDGATVTLSVYRTGTFSFDGERLAWARHGAWLLPFDGEAHYVRALGAWVGICSDLVGHIAACPVLELHGRRQEPEPEPSPSYRHGRDFLFSAKLERHLDANLTYLGDARFCLQETLTREDQDMVSTVGLRVRMLLRVLTFRVEYSADGELCAVDRRARIYKLPRNSSERKPFAFWI